MVNYSFIEEYLRLCSEHAAKEALAGGLFHEVTVGLSRKGVEEALEVGGDFQMDDFNPKLGFPSGDVPRAGMAILAISLLPPSFIRFCFRGGENYFPPLP